MHRRWAIPSAVVYVLLALGIVWQAWGLIETLGPDQGFPHLRSVKMTVSGDVRRPGLYRVPEGTTQFELLQAAGIRPTSDLSNINLLATAGGGDLDVPVRDQPVAIESAQTAPRIESQSGDVTVLAADGSRHSGEEGAFVNAGDTVRTLGSSKAELSMGPRSRVALEELTDLTLDTVAFANGNAVKVAVSQHNGTGWYRVTPAAAGSWRVATPSATATVGGSGAEFLVEVQTDRVSISCVSGTLTTNKRSGRESVNLIAGQAVVMYLDARPFQLSSTNRALDAAHQFAQAGPGSAGANPEGEQQFNFLFCGTPYLYLVIRLQPERDAVSIIHVPPELQVSQFAQGVSTLDQAYLYGGPSFVGSILGRLLNTRITNYCSLSKASVIEVADLLGGVRTEKGTKLSAKELVQYLSPSSSSPEQSLVRQQQVFNAVFDDIRDNKLVISLPTMRQLLGAMETNLDAKELMDQYLRMKSKGDWTRRDIRLPVQENLRNGKIACQPDFDQCRTLFDQ